MRCVSEEYVRTTVCIVNVCSGADVRFVWYGCAGSMKEGHNTSDYIIINLNVLLL